MYARVDVALAGSAAEIAGWLAERCASRAAAGLGFTGLHIPIIIRDAMTFAEWVEKVGHFPTFSLEPVGYACAYAGDAGGEPIEYYRIEVRP